MSAHTNLAAMQVEINRLVDAWTIKYWEMVEQVIEKRKVQLARDFVEHNEMVDLLGGTKRTEEEQQALLKRATDRQPFEDHLEDINESRREARCLTSTRMLLLLREFNSEFELLSDRDRLHAELGEDVSKKEKMRARIDYEFDKWVLEEVPLLKIWHLEDIGRESQPWWFTYA